VSVSPANAAAPPPSPHWLHTFAPWLAIVGIVAIAVIGLQLGGRPWWCACGQPALWVGDTGSEHNSQHLFDPYSFTHVLHGLIYFWLFTWLLPRWRLAWRLTLAVGLAAAWELVENSPTVIERYRAATVSAGYQGDTIANSLGDILSCVLGFGLARWLGWRWSLVYFLVSELVLLLWIRDNLLLTMIMPLWPIEAIKSWQMGG
jgi:Protein of unknown function (DUF2585)